jgi:hypothetical protein
VGLGVRCDLPLRPPAFLSASAASASLW